jgi:hypothetical protein
MNKQVFILLFSIFFKGFAVAQHPSIEKDSSMQHHFQMGTIQGHLRSFYSATYNQKSKEENAYALGGGIKFISKPIHRLQFGLSGFLVYNIFSTDLSTLHPLSASANRYELGLFDVTNPANKTDMDRLEELYIQYQKNELTITLGKQLLNTPFINLQDGRMRPTEVQGVWGQYNKKRNKFYAGWLNQFSPGGTVAWFKANESIGVFSTGVNIDGAKSGYKNQLSTAGVGLTGAELGLTKSIKLQVWNQFVENVFNSSLIQLDQSPTKFNPFYYGIQLIGQKVINQGGNDAVNKTYFNPSQSSFVIGGRLGKQFGQWDHAINFTRITKHGRYLMPREWGRDPFYTFLQGERSEGMGDLTAFMFKSKYSSTKIPLNINLATGYYHLADVKNYAMNKYGLPSYFQYNLDFRYAFNGFWKGWDAQLTYFHKVAIGNTYDDPKFYINKVNMGHVNFILNFHF